MSLSTPTIKVPKPPKPPPPPPSFGDPGIRGVGKFLMMEFKHKGLKGASFGGRPAAQRAAGPTVTGQAGLI